MALTERMTIDEEAFDKDFVLIQARLQSDAELTAAFAPIVDDFAEGFPIHPDMLDGLHKTLGQRYAGLFEQLPHDSRYKKFGEIIQGDIVELLRRIGQGAGALVDRSPHEFSRSAEQCALENDNEDIFDGAALFVGGFVRQHIEVISVSDSE